MDEGAGLAEPADLLVVGRVVAAQGLKGEVRVLPLSDFPERFLQPGSRWLQRRGVNPRQVKLLAGRPLPGRDLYAIRLSGVPDRAAAEALVGVDLMVKATDRPTLAPGEYHLLDLTGLEVRLLQDGENLKAATIGTVCNLLHAGNDLLEVELTGVNPARKVLIPFVEPIVPEVHPAEGWIGITPPPGLLDL